MKKLLNISVIAALAILPLAANADPIYDVTTTDPGATNANAQVAANPPKYSLAAAGANDDTHMATAGYVKGAYNAAIKAINKVATTADSAVKGVQVNGTDLTLTDGKANVTITSGTADGTIKVNNADVAVTGLGSAAYTNSNAYDAAGAASTAETNAKAYADGLASNYDAAGAASTAETNAKAYADGLASNYDAAGAASTAETNAKAYADGLASNYATATQGAKADAAETNIGTMNNLTTTDKTSLVGAINEVKSTALTSSALTDYAKKTGVTQTITNSSISGTVPVLTTWNDDTSENTVSITASIAGATYAEPAQPRP